MRINEILEMVRGPAVLDVGCAGHTPKPGSPYWLHGRLREEFPSVVGIDFNSKNVQQLHNSGYENIYVASAEDFDLNLKFDTIVAGELIEHLSNPGLFFDRCRAHLKPNGRVVLTTPYTFALFYMLYALVKFPRTCQNDEHSVWFCPKTLNALASRTGFQVDQWKLIEDYEFDNPSLSYRIFARVITSIGCLFIPGRLRKNNMIFVFSLK
jgi:2-polyprenyl-3-methyl-5-hydroxy-6-metoxy-1,4-benzoquinol methylase